jgi:hypothetical protein
MQKAKLTYFLFEEMGNFGTLPEKILKSLELLKK